MNITSTNEQKVPITLAPTTESGNPAQVDGAPIWEVLSGDITVAPDTNGLSGFIVSGSTVGTAQAKITADVDMGQEVKTIEVIFDYNVTSPQAANLGVVVGTAVPK
jgi:hypothetical protein